MSTFQDLQSIIDIKLVTEKGFRRIGYDEWLGIYGSAAQYLFGEDFNIEFDSEFGKMLQMASLIAAELTEEMEKIFLSSFVEFAEDILLDYNVKRYGMVRITERKASGSAVQKFTLAAGGTVPADTLVSTPDGRQYRVTAAVTDTANTGSVYANIEAVGYGPDYNVGVGEITELATPGNGIESTTNVAELSNGRSRETDQDLKSRYYNSQSSGGRGPLAKIRSSLLAVPDVRAAVVFENEADTPSPEGYPPHSVIPVVLGGSKEDIAAVLLDTVAGGIRSFGSTTVIIPDDSGEPTSIGFSYAQGVNVDVKVTIRRDAAFPQDGESQVRADVIKYIGGNYQNVTYQGLGMNTDVVQALVLRAIKTPGIADIQVVMKRDGQADYQDANIDIGPVEKAQTDANRVVVEFV